MKLIELQIENIKRIRAIEIHPGPGVTAIGGRNAQGKTSVLDSIEMALAGERSVQPQPVRQGEESGRTVLTFDTGLVVKREFQAGGGSRLVVSDQTGKIKAPQTFLDALTGKGIAFDPLAFLRMDPKKQLETLKRLVGVDFADLDDQRSALESERALAGRDVTGRKTQIESMPQYPGVPVEEVSGADASVDLTKALEFNAAVERLRLAMVAASKDAERAQIEDQQAKDTLLAVIAELEKAENVRESIELEPGRIKQEKEAVAKQIGHALAQIASWQKVLAAAEARDRELDVQAADLDKAWYRVQTLLAAKATAQARYDAAGPKAAGARVAKAEAEERYAAAGGLVDVAPIKDRMAGLDEINAKVRANAARRQLEAQFRQLKDKYEDLTRQIDALDREKARRIAEAPMPVPDLGIGLQGVLYRGLPFEQASSAEQYRVSTAIGFELCPKTGESIRIGLIRDASLLDDDSRKIIAETAAKYDAQLILEVVTEDSADADIIIEDGEIVRPVLPTPLFDAEKPNTNMRLEERSAAE
jgi:hypothetical protein